MNGSQNSKQENFFSRQESMPSLGVELSQRFVSKDQEPTPGSSSRREVQQRTSLPSAKSPLSKNEEEDSRLSNPPTVLSAQKDQVKAQKVSYGNWKASTKKKANKPQEEPIEINQPTTPVTLGYAQILPKPAPAVA